MPKKSLEEKNGLTGLFKKVWLPIAGFLGAVILVDNVYKIWAGNQSEATVIASVLGLVVILIALFWVGTRKDNDINSSKKKSQQNQNQIIYRYSPKLRIVAWLLLTVMAIGGIVGFALFLKHRQETKDKLVVVIATFDGPENVYGLQNEIIETLNANFENEKDIEIVPVKDVVTPADGSKAAVKLGIPYLADVVIWGWYRPTDNPNISIHIENLAPENSLPLGESTLYEPKVTLADLKSFVFQQEAGRETSGLISFILGYLSFKTSNYDIAISQFDSSLDTAAENGLLKDQAEIYLFRGLSYGYLQLNDSALKDFTTAIGIDPNFSHAYNDRGCIYENLRKYDQAIQDLNKAIELDPGSAIFYNNRGHTYQYSNNPEQAILDFSKAIELDPEFALPYNNRGTAYQDSPELAIRDFNKAIELFPKFADAYANRGIAYSNLGEYERAIQDINKAIRIKPNFALAYSNRGSIYISMGKYDLAIIDSTKAIELDPNLARGYSVRGTAYEALMNYDQAIQEFNKAIQLDANLENVYFNRAGAYCILGDYILCIQDLSKAIDLNPSKADYYNNRGHAYKALGNQLKAEADFKKYTELTGKQP